MKKDLRDRSAYKGEYYQKHKIRLLEYSQDRRLDNRAGVRNRHLKTRYGITLSEFNDLLVTQGNECAICKGKVNTAGRSFSVDHCHTTGKVRGLLCNHCNFGLGSFFDSATLLRLAADYLEASK